MTKNTGVLANALKFENEIHQKIYEDNAKEKGSYASRYREQPVFFDAHKQMAQDQWDYETNFTHYERQSFDFSSYLNASIQIFQKILVNSSLLI